jgi:YesN/AraC family two-component response regulator
LDDTEMLALEEEEEANLEEVHDISTMKKARRLVEHFSKSNQQLEKLKEQQKIMETYNEKQAVGMVADVVTRWWSFTQCVTA